MPLAVHGANTPFTGIVTTEIFSLVPPASTGLLSRLPWIPSVYANPQASYITAYDEATGTPPSTLCDTCQPTGRIRTCTQILPYGTLCYASPSITPHDELLRMNQGEPDFKIMNFEGLVSPEVREMLASREGVTAEGLLQNAVAMGMVAVARQLLITTGQWLWSGDPSTGTEGFRAFTGLDSQIRTGIVDAITGDPCPAMDSIVLAYNDDWNAVDSTGSKLAKTLSAVMAVLEERAKPFGGARFAIVVPPALKYYIAMAFYGMVASSTWTTFPTGVQAVLDLTQLNQRREDALAGDKIVINGRTYDFIEDLNIPVTQTTERISNIYIIPLEVGGDPGVYLNYLDYSKAPQVDFNPMIVTDSGKTMWWLTQSGACFTVSGRLTPRAVLRVPRLAAKITSVQWPIEFGPGEAYPGGGRG